MARTMPISSSVHSALPRPPCHRNTKTGLVEMRRRRPMKVSASRGHDNYDGKLVDQDMIVLRMRIHDMKMMTDMRDGQQPPSDWMQWEKKYYANYNSDVCEGVGLLQSQLMNTRPCVALGMVALVTLSVPMSTAALILPLLDVFKGMLANGNIHF